MAEKQRRDNLNTNISTMASLLPTVAGSSRRMDKISILRLAAAFLRTQYTLGHGSTKFLPRKLNEFDLEQYFVDQLIGYGGFFLVVTATGKIVYVSRQVEQHLGHAQNELLGQSLYNFIHPEDHDELTRNLTPDGMTSTPSPTGQTSDPGSDNNSNSSDDSASQRAAETLKLFREQRRSFKIRMSQRTVSRREHTQYEHLNVSGILRLAEACRSTEVTGNRGRHREMTSTSNDVVFAGVASLPRSITELSIIDANKDEYVTRHLVDGRIIFCDHRVSIVAGYLSEEVSGRSAFGFMHKDDYKWTMLGLQQMYLRAVTWGSSCYRLLAKSGEFIYLRTHGYLEYDKDAQSFESFVCVNTLVPEAEGIKLIQEMKQRYSAISLSTSKFMIEDNSPLSIDTNSLSPVQCLEEPAELEAAISNLISDVPSLAVSENHFSPSPMPNMQFVKAAIFSSRLPPVATQANKVGINKIPQHHVIIRDNDKQSLNIKKESNGDKHTCSRKLVNSNGMEQNRISDSKSAKMSGKPLLMFKTMNSVRNGRHNVHSDDACLHSNVLATRESSTNSCLPHNHVSRMDISQSADILDIQERLEQQPDANIENTACNIKIERNVDMFDCLEEQEPVLRYYDSTSSNSSAISPASDSHNRLKRICSDEDLTTVRNKRRSSDVYASSNGNDVRQSVSYANCRTFVAENTYPAITSEFNRYNNTSTQPLMTTAESPNSSLHLAPPEIGGINYQQLVNDHSVATSLVITNPDEEQLNDLQNLKDDTLLNSDLDPNPDIMMKIFDDLRLVTGLDKNFDGAKVEQLTSNDQAVNDEIKRTYRQLANNIALRESQFNVLARDLEIPALRAQRENLSQLQVEHNIQKQMLKTLQQDHRNMQINVKHNMGM